MTNKKDHFEKDSDVGIACKVVYITRLLTFLSDEFYLNVGCNKHFKFWYSFQNMSGTRYHSLVLSDYLTLPKETNLFLRRAYV
jgi:hypothetical protein